MIKFCQSLKKDCRHAARPRLRTRVFGVQRAYFSRLVLYRFMVHDNSNIQ